MDKKKKKKKKNKEVDDNVQGLNRKDGIDNEPRKGKIGLASIEDCADIIFQELELYTK